MKRSIPMLGCLLAASATLAVPGAHSASAHTTQSAIRPSVDLLGDWHGNGDGIVRLVIRRLRPGWVSLSAYGACQPRLCKWRLVGARLFADNAGSSEGTGLIATYDQGFDVVTLTAHLARDLAETLRVETYTRFTDGSGRSDYWALVRLRRY